MKTESDVRDRVVTLLDAELQRRVRQAGERYPTRCAHNHRQPLDARKQVNGEVNPYFNRVSQGVDDNGQPIPVTQTIGLCLLQEPAKHLTICEEELDAKRCPYFCPSQGKAELFQSFLEQLQDPPWVEENLPEVHALLWVLEQMGTPRLSWWRRLWFRYVAKIRIEPALPAFDPSKLLAPPAEDAKSL